MLFALHTSGTTAKPKAAVHTTGGYLTYASVTHRWIFDIQRRRRLLVRRRHRLGDRAQLHRLRAARQRHDQRALRGRPDAPRPGAALADHRALRRHAVLHGADADPRVHQGRPEAPGGARPDLAARCWASVGEPINPEAWVWYWKHIGGERCPIVDTWWQTETGGILITPLPGADDAPSRARPRARSPASGAAVVDDHGDPVRARARRLPGAHAARGRGCSGRSTTTTTATSRTTSRASARHVYFAGDGAPPGRRRLLLAAGPGRRRDERVRPPALDDRARVDAGRAPGGGRGGGDGGARPARPARRRSASCCCAPATSRATRWRPSCASGSAQKIGKIARPKAVIIVDDLPKTRSGKIMRRLLQGRRRGPRAGRHDHAARPGRGRGAEAEGRRRAAPSA